MLLFSAHFAVFGWTGTSPAAQFLSVSPINPLEGKNLSPVSLAALKLGPHTRKTKHFISHSHRISSPRSTENFATAVVIVVVVVVVCVH